MRFVIVAILVTALGLALIAGSAAGQAEELANGLYLPAVMSEFLPSWHWGDTYTTTVSSRTTNPPLAAIDHSGRPHLFWSYSIADNQIHHVYLDGETWHSSSPSTGIEGDSSLTNAPVVTNDNRVHLTWYNRLDTSGDCPYRYLHAIFANETWSGANEVFRSKYSTINAWPRLDAGGRLRVGITNGFLAWRAYLQYEGIGGWQELATFSLPNDADIVWPDASNGAHLYGNDSADMRYWRWTGGTLAATGQSLGPGKLFGRSVTIDGANNVHVYWKAAETVDNMPMSIVHHQCIDNQLRSSAVTWPGDTQAAREMVGATDGGSLFALAWQEPARKRIMLWDGCNSIVVTTIPSDPAKSEVLRAVAVSNTPRKVCVFLQEGTSADYAVRCADID